jgi:hypothetical protein
MWRKTDKRQSLIFIYFAEVKIVKFDTIFIIIIH